MKTRFVSKTSLILQLRKTITTFKYIKSKLRRLVKFEFEHCLQNIGRYEIVDVNVAEHILKFAGWFKSYLLADVY